jgi:hypothetical protein
MRVCLNAFDLHILSATLLIFLSHPALTHHTQKRALTDTSAFATHEEHLVNHFTIYMDDKLLANLKRGAY